MKKLIAAVLTILLIFSAPVCALAESENVWAQEPTSLNDFNYKTNVYDRYVAIEKYIGDDTKIWISSSYVIDGVEYGVQLYGDSVFSYSENITSVIIDEGIVEVPAATFAGCDQLEYLYLPSTMGKAGALINSIADSIKVIYYGGTNWDWYSTVEDVSEEILMFIPVYCNSVEVQEESRKGFTGELYDPKAAVEESAYVVFDDQSSENAGSDNAGEWAADYTPINSFLYTLDKNAQTITLIRYDGDSKKIALSPVYTIDGVDYQLISLGDDGCFFGEANITSVYIPEGVVYAGTNCFNSCTSLQYLYIPSTMTSVTDDFLDYLHDYTVHFNSSMSFRNDRDTKDYTERNEEISEAEEAGRDAALAANAFVDGFFSGLLGEDDSDAVEIYFGGTEEQWDAM